MENDSLAEQLSAYHNNSIDVKLLQTDAEKLSEVDDALEAVSDFYVRYGGHHITTIMIFIGHHITTIMIFIGHHITTIMIFIGHHITTMMIFIGHHTTTFIIIIVSASTCWMAASQQ